MCFVPFLLAERLSSELKSNAQFHNEIQIVLRSHNLKCL